MRSALSSCRLYSWMRLIWQSKMVSGLTIWPDVDLSQSAKCNLASRLALRSSPRKASSSASGLSSLNLPRSVTQPSPMASVIAAESAGFASSNQRRGVTPLVLLLKRSGNISARSLTVNFRSRQQGRMNGGDAVGTVRAGDRHVRHAHFALGTFLDQAHALNASLVPGKASPDGPEKAAIDLVDDLQVTRQHALEPGERPFLQCLGQQRVIGIGQSPLREVPRLVPAEMHVVEQNPHQLRYRHRRVGIIQLDGDLLGKRDPISVVAPKAAQEIGQRAGDEKILLFEAQRLPPFRTVIGIQHPGQRFGCESTSHRCDEIAAAEFLEVEIVGRSCGP